mmetsp:Transcript_36758/g.117024  ORF Transcript_36758/g.117024 Transcript_36758/m.117024 type:complete len:237 (-) Transcript_36758:977-1687(-)|eukprot:scaffold29153_cov107-Isochrysis_galbana.AAC.6
MRLGEAARACGGTKSEAEQQASRVRMPAWRASSSMAELGSHTLACAPLSAWSSVSASRAITEKPGTKSDRITARLRQWPRLRGGGHTPPCWTAAGPPPSRRPSDASSPAGAPAVDPTASSCSPSAAGLTCGDAGGAASSPTPATGETANGVHSMCPMPASRCCSSRMGIRRVTTSSRLSSRVRDAEAVGPACSAPDGAVSFHRGRSSRPSSAASLPWLHALQHRTSCADRSRGSIA